nr:hypothetical protein B0A51_02953 [Rachicladosporium sp. CCFEE 5018]
MIIRQCLRAFQQHPLRRLRCSVSRRLASTTTTPSLTTRLTRLESRLPRFLRHITTPLRTAPLSHITAFLLLHELTAIVPLLALATAFHQCDYLPPVISEGKWVKEGTVKFGGYMKRKGWIGEEGSWWGTGEGAVRVVMEVATAWAVVKLLLPVRLVVSVWGTPWFARWSVVPVGAWLGRVVGRVKGKAGMGSSKPAAGTGAVGGGVGPREGVK